MLAEEEEKQDSEYLQKLGDRIVFLRKERKLSQKDLAHECGWDKPNLRKLEKGKGNPTVKTLLKLSRALKLEVKDLLDI